LRELFPAADYFGSGDMRVTTCTTDSRTVQPGDLFAAISGVHCDGHDYAAEAVARGAVAILAERPLPIFGTPICIVPDARRAYGQLCQALVGNPSQQVRVIGITGTNGKTTTTALAAAVLRNAGTLVGTIGTLGFCDGLETSPASHTTPPAPVAAQWLAQMAANGCSHAVMEVSSHALAQSRTAGIQFDAACFTNIRRDHLDYHGTLVNYRRAKARLLEGLSPEGVVVVNVDDPECAALVSRTQAPVKTISLRGSADATATVIERDPWEQVFLLHVGENTIPVRTRMIGDHHVYNCLCAVALGLSYHIDLHTIVRGLERLEQVPGRMERVECGQPFGTYVDYAHTPDALQTCLKTLKQVTPGKVICVFGAGGNRDPRKRPLMGTAVEREADVAILTSDNPRYERPADIAREILAGFNRPSKAQVILDREDAIHTALAAAEEGDSVLIAGKGHESYQEIGPQQLAFDDREVARDFLYHMAARRVPVWVRS
jgi:UDP-N-acetylmuramoyl-L-alanyl-D-glutamate--2,6-diaminopimelate ligase